MYRMTVTFSFRGRSYEYVRQCESVWKSSGPPVTSSPPSAVGINSKPTSSASSISAAATNPTLPRRPPALSPLRPFFALCYLWHQLGLPQLLGPLSDRVLVLVANHLTATGSEHALTDWLRSYFARDVIGSTVA